MSAKQFDVKGDVLMVDCLKDEKETKQGNKRVVLYTIHCKDCKRLEKKLIDAGVHFDVCDDIKIMFEKNFKAAPMLEVDGVDYTYLEALKWLENRG